MLAALIDDNLFPSQVVLSLGEPTTLRACSLTHSLTLWRYIPCRALASRTIRLHSSLSKAVAKKQVFRLLFFKKTMFGQSQTFNEESRV